MTRHPEHRLKSCTASRFQKMRLFRVTKGLPFCTLVVTFFSHPPFSLAQTPKFLSCRGNLSVYGSHGSSFSKYKNSDQGFVAYSSQTYDLLVASDPKRPYVRFMPWLGIQHTLFPDNYQKDLALKIETDSESYINIQITGRRSGITRQLRCMVGIDDSPGGTRTPSSLNLKNEPSAKAKP